MALVDVGELLWKLLLWPGAEEEHRSLAAGRSLRQDLLTHAEALGLETVGDLCVTGGEVRGGKQVSVEKLLDVLKSSFACGDISDLDMYLRHFADDKGVALEKRCNTCRLYDHGPRASRLSGTMTTTRRRWTPAYRRVRVSSSFSGSMGRVDGVFGRRACLLVCHARSRRFSIIAAGELYLIRPQTLHL